MNIQLASDLHLEMLTSFPGYTGIEHLPGTELLVLAGDIHGYLNAFDLFESWPTPVLYILGNHEYYHEEYYTLLYLAKKRAKGSNVHLLEKSVYIQGDVRFLGTTLWTDYKLYGTQKKSMSACGTRLRDHSVIGFKNRPFLSRDALSLHKKSVTWLGAELAKPFEGKTVVLSHHGPHIESIHPGYRNHDLNPGYASDLSELFPHVDVWCHGHSHASVAFQKERCRVFANPRGLPLNRRLVTNTDELRFENPDYNPAFSFSI